MAAGLRAKLELWQLEAWRTVEREDEGVGRALERYAVWLREWRVTLEEREAVVREVLEGYRGLEEVVKVWKGLREEMRGVGEMVERLEGGDGGREGRENNGSKGI